MSEELTAEQQLARVVERLTELCDEPAGEIQWCVDDSWEIRSVDAIAVSDVRAVLAEVSR